MGYVYVFYLSYLLLIPYSSSIIYRSYQSGTIKGTNALRELHQAITKDQLPPHWLADTTINNSIALTHFLNDFIVRLRTLESYGSFICGSSAQSSSVRYRMGDMFAPESFITAIRQLAAQVYYHHIYTSRHAYINLILLCYYVLTER